MAEVLDSRPVSNLELLAGRFLGILIPSWIPVVILALLMELLGLLLPALGSPVGDAVEPWSMVAFTLAMTLPAFALALALVFLVTLLVRNRLLAAVVMLVILGANTWAMWMLPIKFGPLLDLSGAYSVAFPSDIVPAVAPLEGWLQRIGGPGGGLWGALPCLCCPPQEGRRSRRNESPSWRCRAPGSGDPGRGSGGRNQGEHRSGGDLEAGPRGTAFYPDPDIRSISGEVAMDPGRNLALSLDVVLSAPERRAPELHAPFLEPGSDRGFRGERNGREPLVQAPGRPPGGGAVPSPGAGSVATLNLQAHGKPDLRFGYLDAVRDPLALTAWEGQLYMLGFDKAVYDKSFAALMPGIRWLPAAGRMWPGETRRPDFFETDLTVRIPEGLARGRPGPAQELGAGEFRFQPEYRSRMSPCWPGPWNPTASRSKGVDGSPDPPPTPEGLDDLADAGPEVRELIAEKLRGGQRDGDRLPVREPVPGGGPLGAPFLRRRVATW